MCTDILLFYHTPEANSIQQFRAGMLQKLRPNTLPRPSMRHAGNLVMPAKACRGERGAPAFRHACGNNAIPVARKVQLGNVRRQRRPVYGIQRSVQGGEMQGCRPETVIQIAGDGAKEDDILSSLRHKGDKTTSTGKAIQGQSCRPGDQPGLIKGGGDGVYRAFAHAA